MSIVNPGPEAKGVKDATVPAIKTGFWTLNWLRFLLALYLVLFHTLRVSYPLIEKSWFGASLSLGNMATSVFFVLSGFLLTHAYVVMKNGREINRRNFLIARFSTIYPLHIVALVLAVGSVGVTLFAQGGIVVATESPGPATRVLAQWEVMLGLFSSITLLNAWNPFYMVFNGPSWSLSALGFYYLMFPALAAKIYRMKSPKAALVLLAILFLLPGAIADLLQRTDMFTVGLLHRNPIIRLPLFIAGMVLCVLFARSKAAGTPVQWILSLGLIGGTIVLATILQHQENHSHLIQNGLYFPVSLAIIWLCVCTRTTIHDRLRYWGDRLGAASLPMFLLHMPLFGVFRKAEQVATVWSSTSGGLVPILAAAREAEQSIAFYPLYLVLLVVVCVIAQERFVTPIQKAIRNRFSGRSQAAQPSTAASLGRATGTY